MRTLAGRVTLIVTLAVAAVLAVVGAVVIAEVGRRERATFQRELRAAATRAEQPARRALLGGTPNAALERAVGEFSVRLTRRGRLVYDDLGAPGVPIPPRTGVTTVTAGTGERWRVVVLVVRPRREGRLVVSGSLAQVEERIAHTRRTLVIAFVLGLAACALATRSLTARTLRPLGRLREGAANVSSTRDLTTRVAGAGVAEVDEVARALNAMLARLEASAAAGERFTADAGHELRTPLTSLRANVAALRHDVGGEAVAGDALGPAERALVLGALERDLERLTRLLDGLQALARGDAGASAHAPVDLGDLADAALADARRRHPAVAFEITGGELSVDGDESGLRSALDNLLENAARHGARRVRVTIEPDGVLVDDDGPGIARDQRERVFERFTRGPAAAAPGSGLGLAIVAQQAALHGGIARIDDSPLGGARLALIFPKPDRLR